jgi:penicillin G amidase
MKTSAIFLILSFAIWALLLFSLHHTWERKGNTLPALGAFLSPFHGFWQNAETKGDFADVKLSNPASSSEVSIVMDDRLVPYIFADNPVDAAFAQGYLHARYRLWQVDISLRDISGRLSEVFGARTLERDRQTRRQGFVWAAEENLKLYQQDTLFMRIMDSYLSGFNQYVQTLSYKDYPLEFKLLNYCPGELTLQDLVLLSKNLARTLTMKEYDLASSVLVQELGAELFDVLYPVFHASESPVHPSDNKEIRIGTRLKDSLSIPPISLGQLPDASAAEAQHFASNNWAVAPAKTQNGNPILCNDPHLDLTLPSIWYETAIITPAYRVRGVSLPGLPSVIVGFNEHVAWGFTNGGHDVLDWVAISWDDREKGSYRLGEQVLTATTREERIGVKGTADHVEQVRYTHWGPVAMTKEETGQDLAMHWTAHYAYFPDEILTFYYLNKAKTTEDYIQALERFPSPIQNAVFAAINGDIALKSTGHWPKRLNYSGMFVSDGANPASSWSDILPFEEIPYTLNPARGYVSSANQHSTFRDFPHLYFGNFEGYRGRTLNQLLENGSNLTTEDMKTLQHSTFSLKAQEALPAMLRHMLRDSLDANQLQALQLMEKWNFEFRAEAWEPVLFHTWYEACEEMAFEEVLGEEARRYRDPEKWVLSHLLNTAPEHRIFDDSKTAGRTETAGDILYQSFQKAWKQAGMDAGGNDISWVNYLKPTIYHLAKIPAFSVQAHTGGSKDALNAMNHGNGPSWRMIVEMTPNGPDAQGIYPGGQSGNPGSRYYDNAIKDWASGQYYRLALPARPEEVSNTLFRCSIQ